MSIVVNGRDTWLGQIWADGMVEAVYSGDVMVWPDVSGEDGGIMIEAPPYGSLDYLYWLHAVDATETGPVSDLCYLKFTVDGVDYYVNNAPNGKQVVELDGNVLKLTKRQKEALSGKLTDSIQLEAEVPERGEQWRTFRPINSTSSRFSSVWYLPMLPGTRFHMSMYKGQKREWAYTQIFEATSLPSGEVIALNSSVTATSKGRYDFHNYTRVIGENELVLTDSATKLTYNAYGASGVRKGVTPIWPKFSRVFNLDIISIF